MSKRNCCCQSHLYDQMDPRQNPEVYQQGLTIYFERCIRGYLIGDYFVWHDTQEVAVIWQ